MKSNKKLKLVLIIAIIILLSIIGFVGVYMQNKNTFENVLPEYLLGMELKGYRRIVLNLSSDTRTVKYDSERNEIAETDTETEVASTEEKKVNDESITTKENYKKVKKIIKQRLDKMGIQEYFIRQDLSSGNIIVQVPEDDKTDSVVAQLQSQGKFEIVDNETNEVLMTNDDIKEVKAGYGTTSYGTSIYLSIEFNKEGKEKFKNITNTYIEVSENEDETQEQSDEAETDENSAEEATKEIAIKVDDSTLLTTHFDEEISNGILQLSVGSSSNSTQEELQEYYEQASSMAALLDSGKMPIVYEIGQNKYVQSDITNQDIVIGVAAGIVALTILMIVMIIKNKEKGILASISLIGYIAILTIVLRYTNVIISMEGIAAIIFSIILEYVFLQSALNKEQQEFWNVYVKYIWTLIPIAVIAVVFALAKWLPISSFGMVMFWGIVVKFIWNAIITRNILNIKK